MFLKNFMNRKKMRESMEYIIILSIKKQWRYSIELFKIPLSKQKERYYLKESINDFLIYYNNREHLTTKVIFFEVIMKVENKDLIHKILENLIKRKQKANMLTETIFKNIIVSILIILDSLTKSMWDSIFKKALKSVSEEEWIVVGKISEPRSNYCRVKTFENPSNYYGL